MLSNQPKAALHLSDVRTKQRFDNLSMNQPLTSKTVIDEPQQPARNLGGAIESVDYTGRSSDRNINTAAISRTTEHHNRPLVDDLGRSDANRDRGVGGGVPKDVYDSSRGANVTAGRGGIAWELDQPTSPSHAWQMNRTSSSKLGANSTAANFLNKIGLSNLAKGGVIVLVLDILLTLARLVIRAGVYIVRTLMNRNTSVLGSQFGGYGATGFTEPYRGPQTQQRPSGVGMTSQLAQYQQPSQGSGGTILAGVSLLASLLRPLINIMSPTSNRPSEVARFEESQVDSRMKSIRPSTMGSLARVATAAIAGPAVSTGLTASNLEALQENIMQAIKLLGNTLQTQIDQLHSEITALSNMPNVESGRIMSSYDQQNDEQQPQQRKSLLSRIMSKEPEEYKVADSQSWGAYRHGVDTVGGNNPNVRQRKRGFL